MAKFKNISTAIDYRNRCFQPSKWVIVLGDDEKFWLLTNRQASRLLKQGYELAAY